MSDEHVFLSYRSNEIVFTKKLAFALYERGLKMWMDKLKGIKAGDDWVRTLEVALNESEALIAVLTPDYTESGYCLAELHRVHSRGKPVFPVLLRDVPEDKYPLEIQRTQYVDFRKHEDPVFFKSQLDQLLEGILKKTSLRVTSHLPPLEEGEELTGRKLDAEIKDSKTKAAALIEAGDLEGILVADLLERMKIVEEQLRVTLDQRLRELSGDTKVILNRKVTHYQAEYKSLRSELDALVG